jgi:putative transposase
MPRAARIVLPGLPHHVIQRGNNRQDVFFVEDDRRAYLELLAQQSAHHGLSILAYCLMSNHVHLVVIPREETSLARAVGRAHWLYTQYINRLHGRSGHLWQNRYFSCPLDERHTFEACVYVERNPVRSRIVRLAWRYPWSSAAAHVGEAAAPAWLDVAAWRMLCEPRGWRRQLQRPEDEAAAMGLRAAARRGRPLGSDSFMSKLEHRLGRRLRARPVGRPKGSKTRRRRRRGG